MEGFIQLVTVIIIFGIVLAATYFVTVWVGNFQKAQFKGRNMELLEAMRLTPNQYIQIVRICGTYYILAVSKENVTMLGTLSEEEAALFDQDDGMNGRGVNASGAFRDLLDKALKRSGKKD
ncbi:MAG: flagellar biosynthetic protein FliO [Lachnospiraceae bacterium]|nr:flagellar biosynthetic protein FliO [Lachnospiraceae bacterium]